MKSRKRLAEAERTDPRCKKEHRPRIDFKSHRLRWFCETCHAELKINESGPVLFVLADNPDPEEEP